MLRSEGDGGWGSCFEKREMDGGLMMMRQGDGGSPMEYNTEETYIRKAQEFYFDEVQ